MLAVVYVWGGKRSVLIDLPQDGSSVILSFWFSVMKPILGLSGVELCYLALNGDKSVQLQFQFLIFLRSQESCCHCQGHVCLKSFGKPIQPQMYCETLRECSKTVIKMILLLDDLLLVVPLQHKLRVQTLVAELRGMQL